MRLVIDTNVLISALLSGKSLPAHLLLLWRDNWFDLLTSAQQLEEFSRVTRYPKIRERLPPAFAGRLVNEIRTLGVMLTELPRVTRSPDPRDDYLLAMAVSGSAEFIVTGDKRDLLFLKIYEGAKIITVRDFLILHRRMP